MELLGTTTGAKTASTDLFTADLKNGAPSNYGGFIKLFVSVATTSTVTITIDGTNYTALNSGNALTADVGYEFNIPTKNGDDINFQLGSSVTVDIFDVYYFD